jgi:lincosamide nucleotidyltransferase
MPRAVLPQLLVIELVRRLCAEDTRVTAALMYGSFAKGEGDAWSDIEFWVFFAGAPPEPADWVATIAPLRACFPNEFGTRVVVFENGVRGEFHLEPDTRLPVVRDWARQDPRSPSSWTAERGGLQIVADRTGELTANVAHLEAHVADRTHPERVQALCDGLANFLLLGTSVLGRGEHARALDALSCVHRYLIWMVRVLEGSADRHWPTPSRAAEVDLSDAAYARLRRCTASLDPPELQAAYAEAQRWSAELMGELVARYGVCSRADLLETSD